MQKLNKKLLIILLSAFVLLVSACTVGPVVSGSGKVSTEERQIKNVTGVALLTSGDLTITQGETESLTIEAEDNILPLLTSEVNNGTLTLGVKFSTGFTVHRPIKYNLTVRELKSLNISGSGDVNCDQLKTDRFDLTILGSGDAKFSKMEAPTLTVKVAGSGDVEVKTLNGDRVDVSIQGSGNVDIAGTAKTQKVNIAGSGNYKAKELESSEVEVKILGSGDVTIMVSKTLDVEIMGSGSVYYSGDPSKVNVRDMGSGDIKKR